MAVDLSHLQTAAPVASTVPSHRTREGENLSYLTFLSKKNFPGWFPYSSRRPLPSCWTELQHRITGKRNRAAVSRLSQFPGPVALSPPRVQ